MAYRAWRRAILERKGISRSANWSSERMWTEPSADGLRAAPFRRQGAQAALFPFPFPTFPQKKHGNGGSTSVLCLLLADFGVCAGDELARTVATPRQGPDPARAVLGPRWLHPRSRGSVLPQGEVQGPRYRYPTPPLLPLAPLSPTRKLTRCPHQAPVASGVRFSPTSPCSASPRSMSSTWTPSTSRTSTASSSSGQLKRRVPPTRSSQLTLRRADQRTLGSQRPPLQPSLS